MSIGIWTVIALAAAPHTAPPYFTAQERWTCTFDAFEGSEQVISHFGVYRSHVRDDFGAGDLTIVQNDEAALVFVMSDIGNTDIEGKTRKWVLVSMIDKKTRSFKRSLVEFEGRGGEVEGHCRPY